MISAMHEAAELFRALADPTRLAVFESVVRREMSVSELTDRFDVSQPAIRSTSQLCELVVWFRSAGKGGTSITGQIRLA